MRRVVRLSACMLLLAVPVHADGMRVDPGKWEFRTTSKQPMAPPRTNVSTACVEEPTMTPQRFMKESGGCTVKDAASDTTSMKWAMACENPGGNMTGNAKFTSTGATVSGVMRMHMDVAGRQMHFEQSWDGKRLGACD